MSYIFIIMQIGDSELDEVCEKAIVPAIRECGFDAKRVDKHNKGGLLKSEIIEFIQGSDLIIADLTNERPNCYLEIGYAMGLDKFKNLILTVREDHFLESPNHKMNGAKIHFDLSGYDILSWEIGKESEFKEELKKRIKRRITILGESGYKSYEIWDSQWLKEQNEIALKGLRDIGFNGGMEIKFTLANPQISVTQRNLDDAARSAEIQKSGWPIGIYIPEYKPKPRSDGIYVEIPNSRYHTSYDYWAIRKNGAFYMLLSLFEESKEADTVWIETRISRVTEALLYCGRLYNRLGVDRSHKVHFSIKHFGLKNKRLEYANSLSARFHNNIIHEDQSETEIEFVLSDIENNIVKLVKDILSPMFMLFNYYELEDGNYENIVNKFINSKI